MESNVTYISDMDSFPKRVVQGNEKLINKLSMSPEDKVLSSNYGNNYDTIED